MARQDNPVVVIWNSASGWSDDERQARCVHEVLSRGNDPVRFERIDKGGDIAGKSAEFVKNGTKLLIAAGGDGTINAVASVLVNTDAALGVIPAGTLNHFARDLSIPLTANEAASALIRGREIKVDVGSVNNRIFLNNSVLGLYPVYRAARDAYERRGLGGNRFLRFLAVVRGIARVFWRIPKFHLRFILENGSSLRVKTAFVLIANNEHELEQWNIGHRTSLDSGKLWIYILKHSTRWSLVKFFVRFLFKRFSRHDAFRIFKAQVVQVDSRVRHLKIGLDGEILRLETPLEYRSLPLALRVIAPANYQGENSALEP